MKSKILAFGILGAALIFIPGCSGDGFFDIQSAMSAPKLSPKQEITKNAIKEYLGDSITWKQPLINGKYSSAISCENFSDDSEIQIAFCGVAEELGDIHILFLKQINDKVEVFKDVDFMASNIKKACICDINGDGKDELLIFASGSSGTEDFVKAYKYCSGDVCEVDVPKSFFDE